jgi:serine/threonine protein kinase
MKPRPRRDPYRLTGEVFSQRYRLEEYAGMGSFGAVYRALDTRLGRTVAVKILKPDLGDDEATGARELFQREALTAGRLTHPHIVAVTDVGEEAGFAYLVMEWLEGVTLEDELRARHAPLSLEETAMLLAQITDALQTAHDAGVIHRDIKPSNIHLGRRGRPFVKMLDFGIAKVVTSSTAVAASRIAGTVAYMSPEQITGSRIDRRSDIYSMGILLYQMLTGELPFRGESQGQIIQQHIAAPPPLLSAARPDLPPALSQVVQKALGKLPEARQQSAQEFNQEFAAALRAPADRDVPRPEPKPPEMSSLAPTVVDQQTTSSPPPLPTLKLSEQATQELSPDVSTGEMKRAAIPMPSSPASVKQSADSQIGRSKKATNFAKRCAVILGIAFISLGLIGFAVPNLFGLHLSFAHNLVHLVSGATAFFFGWRGTLSGARRFCRIFGVAYLLLGVVGFLLGHPYYDYYSSYSYLRDLRMFFLIPGLPLGTMDHFLHMLLGGLFLIGGFVSRVNKQPGNAPTRET